MNGQHQTHAHIAVARNDDHTRTSVRGAFRDLLDRMDPPLPAMIRTGDHVLVKPFLRYGGGNPESRMISHPEVIAMAIEAVRDCGAMVTLGDEASTRMRSENHLSDERWIYGIAESSGANLVSFAKAGARRVRGGMVYPRTYLISRAVLDVDKVVNCANFQPHGPLVLSGAVKNMFSAVVGRCQQHLHNLFPRPEDIARVIVDVCTTVKPTVSFLDLTTVRDPTDTTTCHPVALLLAGTDPVALDAIAARAAGFEGADAPTIRLGQQMGLGCADTSQITVAGMDWQTMQAVQVKAMPSVGIATEGFYCRTTRFINNVALRPRPEINQKTCSGCGDCRKICPVEAIHLGPDGMLRISLWKCAHCHLCIRACESNAVSLQFGGVTKAIRRLMNKPLTVS
ncbi:DUF362 domain-containing protein [Polaromonas sp. C04]|uniref:DUF362 domain-containing protein n=1 Tax=Polaromonas sp. C04 TaxID=1945857 RepID=UPI00098557D6|nr:DUF362 domain-containing protein [Polaromonas sp. C04]OOG52226.1 hypothetical protein B0E49_12690 [Polaromonas sp. C04]